MEGDAVKDTENGTAIVSCDQFNALPILPLRGVVAFPQMKVPFGISSKSAKLIEDVIEAD